MALKTRHFIYFIDKDNNNDVVIAAYTNLANWQIYKIVEKVKAKNPCEWQFCDIAKEICKKDKACYFCSPVEKVYI